MLQPAHPIPSIYKSNKNKVNRGQAHETSTQVEHIDRHHPPWLSSNRQFVRGAFA